MEQTEKEDHKELIPVEEHDGAPVVLHQVMGLDELLKAQEEMGRLISEGLKQGRDYGVVPGTKRATLFKPGAERLSMVFGVYPRYSIVDKEVDHDRVNKFTKWVDTDKKPSKELGQKLKAENKGRWRKRENQWVWQEVIENESVGLYRYVVRCELVHRKTGTVVGDGIGSCSTMESKYIDRPRDVENTILKMAEKRAFIAAVINAFSLSDRFTQDVEDEVNNGQ